MELLLEHGREAERASSVSAGHPPHILGLDVARVIACLGVVWFHTAWGTPYNAIGYFRNPFFATLLAFLVASSVRERRGFRQFAQGRALRLLLPFALWLVLYSLADIWRGRFSVPSEAGQLLSGLHAIHLWFLPFAFCASLAAYGLAHALLGMPERSRFRAVIALAVLGTAWGFLRVDPAGMSDILPLWGTLGGAVLLGTALAFLKTHQRLSAMLAKAWPVWLGAWPVLLIASLYAGGILGKGLVTFSGVVLFLAGLTVPVRRHAVLWTYLGRLCYGVYLCHYGLIFVFDHWRLKGPAMLGARYGLVVAASVGLTALLQRFAWGRLLVGLPVRVGWRKARIGREMPAGASAALRAA